MYLYHVLFVTMNIYGIDCQKNGQKSWPSGRAGLARGLFWHGRPGSPVFATFGSKNTRNLEKHKNEKN
jgi:hypothetical protein